MLEDQFWQIVNSSRAKASDCATQTMELQRLLAELPASEILGFDHTFRQKVIEAYRWDLWGIAYLIRGGCSDDSFEYFCYWLIGQGSEAYRKVLANPQAILEYLRNGAGDEEIECEELLYASSDAYKNVTGEEMPLTPMPMPALPEGEEWEEDDLVERFPQVAEKYWID